MPHFLRNFFSYVLMLLFFFVHYYVLFPKLYHPKKWTQYTVALIISCLLIFYLPQFLFSIENNIHPPLSTNSPPGNIFFRLIYFNHGIFFQYIAVWLLSLFLKLEERLQITTQQKLTAELNFLKAKINPHFLFNTLNNIYALALLKAEETPDSILKLSQLTRYVVTESESHTVLLSKEIEQIENFIALQKLRISDKTKVNYKVIGNIESQKIAPLLFINYIENAFKYGVSTEKPSHINIEIEVSDFNVNLAVENTIVVNREQLQTKNTQEGMNNNLKRLKILYPEKFNLQIIEENNTYCCKLYIDLS